MKQQTAVEWFFEQMPFEWSSSKSAFEALQQAKEMEKNAIEKAVTFGNRQYCYDATKTLGEQYYNQTYKNFKPGTGETEQQ